MGYSENRNSMLRVEPLLILLTKTESTILIPSNSPRETLYSLREGLRYAEKHNVEKYKDLKGKFILKEKPNGIEVTLRRQIHFEEPIVQLAKSQHLVIDTATQLLEVIGAAIHHKAPSMEFPKSDIKGDAFSRLERWCAANQYIIIQSEPHIIMERVSIDAGQESESQLGERGVV
jgi:hypothetical protein